VRWVLIRLLEWIWYRRNPLKWLLWPLSWIYGAVARLRQASYRVGLKSVTKLRVPVIVIGNITVGGTGKTPSVIWLARELTTRGYRVGIVSRGYGGRGAIWPQRVESGSDPAIVGDEPVLIARATGCRVVVGPDRVAAAQGLLDHAEVDVLLCDDGLQHHALGRDMEIVVVDGHRGLGNGLYLPAGPLRERASRLRTVDAVLVNGGTWYYQGVLRASTVPQRVYQLAGDAERSLEDFRGEHVHAVAGIGNPQRFYNLLTEAGVIVTPHSLPDHAPLRPADLKFRDNSPVLVTEKDAVKCESFAADNVWCVAVAMEFESDHGDRLMQRVMEIL
jgi:tetraacyldisaccharide 4'-kinase